MNALLAYAHPFGGLVACSLMIWVGFQGLRSRQRRLDAPASRARHRAWAPRVWGLVLGVALAGAASVVLLRDDLHLGGSTHGWVASGVVGLLTANWASERFPALRAPLRPAHPYLGILAMLGAIWALMLGLELLP